MKSWCIPKELVQFILNRLSVSKMEFCITPPPMRGNGCERIMIAKLFCNFMSVRVIGLDKFPELRVISSSFQKYSFLHF